MKIINIFLLTLIFLGVSLNAQEIKWISGGYYFNADDKIVNERSVLYNDHFFVLDNKLFFEIESNKLIFRNFIGFGRHLTIIDDYLYELKSDGFDILKYSKEVVYDGLELVKSIKINQRYDLFRKPIINCPITVNNNIFKVVVDDKNENKLYLAGWSLDDGVLNVFNEIGLNGNINDIKFDIENKKLFVIYRDSQNRMMLREYDLMSLEYIDIHLNGISNFYFTNFCGKYNDLLILKLEYQKKNSLHFFNTTQNKFVHQIEINNEQIEIGKKESNIYFLNENNEVIKVNVEDFSNEIKLGIKGKYYSIYNSNSILTHDYKEYKTSPHNSPLIKYNLSDKTKKPLSSLLAHPRDIIVNKDKNLICVYNQPYNHYGRLTLFDLQGNLINQEEITYMRMKDATFFGMKCHIKFSENSKYIFGVYDDDYCFVYNIEKHTYNILRFQGKVVLDIEYSETTNKLYISTNDKSISVLEPDSFNEIDKITTNNYIKRMSVIGEEFLLVSLDNLMSSNVYVEKLDLNTNVINKIGQILTKLDINSIVKISENQRYVYGCLFYYDIEKGFINILENSANCLSCDLNENLNLYVNDNYSSKGGLDSRIIHNVNIYDNSFKFELSTLEMSNYSFASEQIVAVKYIDNGTILLAFENGTLVNIDISDLTKSSVPTELILESNLRIVNQNGEFYIESDEDYIGNVSLFDYVGKKYGDYNLILKKGLNKMPDEFDYNFTKILVYKTANKTFLIK